MKTAQLGIELGTRHLRICTRDKEEFLKIKNMIAFDEDAKLKAFGNEAFAMYEKQPYSIHVVKPMEHGVISDYTNMRYLLGTVLDHYFKRIRKTGLMIAVPVDITNVEKRAFEDLAWESASRVKDVTLVPKPILAAIGSGIDVNAPCGNMIIDIGASTTEISVISLGGIVTSRLLPYGGDQIDEWIRDYVKKNYKLAIGTRSARHLKLAYAKIEDKEAAMIKGRDLVSGLPKQEKIPIQIVEEKAHSQVRDICVQVKAVLESITPELASDIMNQGIYVSGGGAAFPKTAEWIKEEFKIPVHIADRPEDHVIPHTDSERVNKSQICFLSLDEPIEFEDMVDKSHKISVELVFMLAMAQPHEQVNTLQNLIALFQDDEKVAKLKECNTEKELMQILNASGIE